MKLQGKRVAILVSPRGTEEPEFVKPKDAVEQAGGTVTVVSFEAGKARTVNNDLDEGGSYEFGKTFDEATADEFDALVVPGGSVGADRLRGNEQAVAFVQAFFKQKKPAVLICHAPWLLVEAGVVKGRKVTSYPTLKTDIENAGGIWVDEEVVFEQGLVTSRHFKDLPAFCAKARRSVLRRRPRRTSPKCLSSRLPGE